MDAVASNGFVVLPGKNPFKINGSPIRVPMSFDQNNKEIRSPTVTFASTVLEIV